MASIVSAQRGLSFCQNIVSAAYTMRMLEYQLRKGGRMATTTNIGMMIVQTPDIRGGRPRIAGTGITVLRIAGWYQMGFGPEEIARKYKHLTLAQIYAALAYYHANKAAIDAEIAAEEAEIEELERQYAHPQESGS